MKHATNIIFQFKQLPLIVAFSLMLLIPLHKSFALNINLDELSKYQLNFASIETTNNVSSNPLIAHVTEKEGENFSVFLPFAVQQVNTLVTNGQYVEKNQKIAYLSGYDVHHFLDEYDAAKKLYKINQKHYKSSFALYKDKALKQSQWVEISNNYFSAKLRFEHLHHFKSFLEIDKNEQIAIIAPISGLIRNSNKSNAKAENELLFDIIPIDAIRLKISAPLDNIENLTSLITTKQDCKIVIDSKESVIHNFSVTAWTTPLAEQCQFILGEKAIVIPVYKQNAFSIDKTAVFEFEDKNYIAVKNNMQLNLVAIDILGSNKEHFIFNTDQVLTNKVALISSVSAIQGLLLNLGDE